MPKRKPPKSVLAMFVNASELEQAFYAALAQGDVEQMMALWVADQSAICILPNFPYAQGHLALSETWRTLFEIGRFKAQVLANHTLDTSQTAVHNQLLHIELTLNQDAAVQHFNLHSTLVFSKTKDGWRVSLFHASVALDTNKLVDEMPRLLH